MENNMDLEKASIEVLAKAKLSNNTEEVARDIVINLLIDYEERINKAIELFENNEWYTILRIRFQRKLLSILKGKNNE